MEFRLLGPVEVRAGGRVVAVGPPQQRLLLAALAVDAGRPVPVQTLVDRMWEEAPAGARRTLYVLVSRLRGALKPAAAGGAPALLVRRGGGYALEVNPQQVDLHRYRRLAAVARDPNTGDGERVARLREAVALWRGDPLSGLPGHWVERTAMSVRQLHLGVVVAWALAELQAGNPGAVVAPLTELAGEHPLTEPLTEVLMRALAATGRAADALALYATTRRRLADELGTDPGAALQAAHQQILRGDLGLSVPTTPAARAPVVPRQLPASPAHFVGRTEDLADLTAILDCADRATTVVVSAIGGTAGVGKTTLAVYWAHQVLDRFPDGQLYVNLRGFDRAGAPLAPEVAIRRLLIALGVAPPQVQGELDALAALYRTELARRRMLILLDNARDSIQVRPLLPGTASCLVLVTSRNQLSGLVATDGAHSINLDVLTPAEARQLLSNRLGPARATVEHDVVDQITIRCAGLPLALAIVAARAVTQPQLSLRTLANELRDVDRLDALHTDDPATDVRAVFSWSYQALTPDAARLFRQLGLHPGPDLSAAAAASLAALLLLRTRTLLGELTSANLLNEHTPGRYTLHDLLRTYAADLARTHDTDHQRHIATHRTLDHYLHSAHNADRLSYPAADPLTLTPPQTGVTPEHPANHEEALAWLTTEHQVLLAIVNHAATTGFDTYTWQLAWIITIYLDRSGHWHDRVATEHAAVAAARRLADPNAQADAHRQLAHAYTRLDQYDEAYTELSHALKLYRDTGDPTGQAHTHRYLAYLRGRQGDHRAALHHAGKALQLFQTADHRPGQARALNEVGWEHAQLGNHQHALTACGQALTLLQELGDRSGQANTWDSLGYTHHHLGNHTQAITSYQHALDLYRNLGDQYNEADTLIRLGNTHHTAGNPHHTQTAWQRALTILDQIHHPNADLVRAKLANLYN